MTLAPMPIILPTPAQARNLTRDPAFQTLLDDRRVLGFEIHTVHTEGMSAVSFSSNVRVLVPNGDGVRWLEGHKAIRDAGVPGLVEACFVLLEGVRDFIDPDTISLLWCEYNPRPYDKVGCRCLFLTRHALVVGVGYPEASIERELRRLETCLALVAAEHTDRAWKEAELDVGGIATMIVDQPDTSAHARLRLHPIVAETFAVWSKAYPVWTDPKWRIGPPQM